MAPRTKYAGERERLAFDAKSKRSYDRNGFLHVEDNAITKEEVAEYFGNEIPNWQELGLEPNRIYKGYRSARELAKAAPTFRGLPLLNRHIKDSAGTPQKAARAGSLWSDVRFVHPHLRVGMTIQTAEDIEALDPKDRTQTPKRELSASYRYVPVFKPGTFNGERYDFEITEIQGNHVALVEEGRAGPDVVVSDSKPKRKGYVMDGMKLLNDIVGLVKGAGIEEHPGGESEAKQALGDDQVPPAETANDDDIEQKAQELYALLDGLEDKDLALRIKTLCDDLRGGSALDKDTTGGMVGDEDKGGIAKDEDKGGIAKDEDKDKPAMDKRPKGRTASVKRSGDTYNVTLAMDSATVQANTIKAIEARYAASAEVKRLTGVDVDPLAFDEATIYKRGIKAVTTKEPVTNDVASLREILTFNAPRTSARQYPGRATLLAMDSKSRGAEIDPMFANAAGIKRLAE